MQTGKPPSLAMKAFCCGEKYAGGFTYIGILIAIVILGVALAQVGVIWRTVQQRESERELLYIGDQFRLAIGRYYNVGSNVGAAHQYPQSLQDLVRDPRLLGVVRHIRKIYYDPMTGDQQWGLIKNTEGRIIGIYSTSQQHPIKQDNFSPADKDFSGKKKYAQWTFIYLPNNKEKNIFVPGKVNSNNTSIPTQGSQ